MPMSNRKSKRKKRAIGLAGILLADHAYSKVKGNWEGVRSSDAFRPSFQIAMSTKTRKAAPPVTGGKTGTGSRDGKKQKRKSWRRLMWDAVSVYDVEAVSD